MPSFDNIHDFYDLLKYQGFEFIIVTLQKTKRKKGEEETTNVDYFPHFKSKKSKKKMLAALQDISESLLAEINEKEES